MSLPQSNTAILILIFDLPHSFNKFDYFPGGLEIGIESQGSLAP